MLLGGRSRLVMITCATVIAFSTAAVSTMHKCQVCTDTKGGLSVVEGNTCSIRLVEKSTNDGSCYTLYEEDTRHLDEEKSFFMSVILGQPWYVYVLILWVLSALEKLFK